MALNNNLINAGPYGTKIEVGSDPMQTFEQLWNLRNPTNKKEFDEWATNLLNLQQSELAYKRSLPENQIAALMSTGMSRSAALQALQPASSSPASLSAPAGGMQELQNIMQGAQTAWSLMSGVASLAMQGRMNNASVNQVVEATNAQRLNNTIGQSLYNAHTKAAQYLQAAHDYKTRTGKDLPDSVEGFIDVLSKDELESSKNLAMQYSQDLSEPYFFNTLSAAYGDLFMDKAELANRLRVQNAFAKSSEWDAEEASYNAGLAWNNFRESLETYQDRVDTVTANKRIANSQASMFEYQEDVAELDRNFWLQFDGKNRLVYLNNQTQQQAYQTALSRLQVEYQEDFNKAAAAELSNRLKQAQALGQDYFDEVASNLLKNEQYRAAVLQLETMRVKGAIEFRQQGEQGDLGDGDNIPFSDNWFRAKIRPLADYFHETGVTDMAIKYSAEAVGFLAK